MEKIPRAHIALDADFLADFQDLLYVVRGHFHKSLDRYRFKPKIERRVSATGRCRTGFSENEAQWRKLLDLVHHVTLNARDVIRGPFHGLGFFHLQMARQFAD